MNHHCTVIHLIRMLSSLYRSQARPALASINDGWKAARAGVPLPRALVAHDRVGLEP